MNILMLDFFFLYQAVILYCTYIHVAGCFFCSITDEVVTTHGPIEPDKENVRQEPYSLPQGFMWDTLDLSSAEVVSVHKTNSHVLFCLLINLFALFNAFKFLYDLHPHIFTNLPSRLPSVVAEGAVHAAERELRRG